MIERTKISLGAVWEEAFAFCKAEVALLAPLAVLCFGLPLVVLDLVMPTKLVVDGAVAVGPWMAWIIPHALFSLLGTLSITALTARAGISVREALQTGVSRMPAGIAVALLAFGAVVLASIPVGIVAGIESSVTGKAGAAFLLAYLLVLVGLAWLAMRLLPVWAAIATSRVNGWATVRATLALTRGLAPQMLLLRIVAWISQFLVMSVLMLPARAIFELIGRATGATALTDLLATLVGSVVAAAIVTLWTVYVALLYRKMVSAAVAAIRDQ
ncbi:hypothetical protein [Sphingomonas abietis]|uniref:Glycerophosphoryl diester phosphodiesterase membrane domain-containing protein n=1 Tax=Sphingomonas abietis TaxID=3012344 RepID=A0ABY7NSB9_9SPHN|nr:hypothetical protein [Sphingomonas abietis]WBO23467.1 hypothetical protein PBT88_04885 [Sphingomonas abietis]